METVKLEVDSRYGEEWAGTYVFSEISWARRSRILERHTQYNMVTGQVESSDNVAIQAEMVMASLRGQPEKNPLTLERLMNEDAGGVPIGFGVLISRTVNQLNRLANTDIRFLLEQLSEANRVQLFQSFGFVKNSDGQCSSSEGSPQGKSRSS